MFKVNYLDLRSNTFRVAVGKLANCQQYKDVKLGFRIGKLAKSIDAELQKSQKEWLELATPLVAKNEKGDFIVDAVKGFTFIDGIEAAQAQKALEDFTKKETIIECQKLTLKDVEPAGLSPVELMALEPLLISLESL